MDKDIEEEEELSLLDELCRVGKAFYYLLVDIYDFAAILLTSLAEAFISSMSNVLKIIYRDVL